MTLSTPSPRKHRHTRTIHAEGFLREDGLWDIEARMIDSKTYVYTEPYRGDREPGSAVHDMAIRLTMDSQLTITAIEVSMAATPYPTCTQVAPNFQGLVGTTIGGGWRRVVNECVGATRGCTHVRELLFPMATVAFQTIKGWPEGAATVTKVAMPVEMAQSAFVNGCYAWAADGDVVAEMYPTLSTRTVAP
ncbi:DUF2889 domain-containing protein [Burkholderiaceae bacterium]|nr:DUF2889 domain-containing protein [Burkholderiaceae bacterium]